MYSNKTNEPTCAEGVVEKATALEDWLDGLTVEDMLGISRRTLQHYRTSRLFPYLKIGNKIYYKRADIEAFLDAEYNKQKGGAR